MTGSADKKPDASQPGGVPSQTLTQVKGSTLSWGAAHDDTVDSSAPPPPMSETPDTAVRARGIVGKVIDGRYQIESILGEGGMGVVFRAKHITLGKLFAIKILRSEVSKNQEVLDRFKQEAQSASAIGNQHIVDISDFGALPDGAKYFVMEYLDGYSLSEALQRGETFPPERLVHIAKQLCEAVAAAHERGIVHRDLKPDNVMLAEKNGVKDFVKVLDFGIAKVGSATNKLTKAGQVVGTPHYMSPEQCGAKSIDHRTDIYSIGVILYEMACGKVPFDADSLMGVLTQHVYSEPEPVSTRRPPHPVPNSLEAIIMKCLSKSPDGRYPTVAALRDDLGRFANGKSLMMPSGIFVDTGTLKNAIFDRPKGKWRWRLAALATVGVGIVLWQALYHSNKPAEPAKPQVRALAPRPPAAPPKREQVKLTTRPEGAEVYRDDVFLGVSPIAIDKPHGDQSAEISLKLIGHDEKKIKITSATESEISVSLEEEQEAPQPIVQESRRRSFRPSRTEKPQEAKGERPKSSPSSDVIDPWN